MQHTQKQNLVGITQPNMSSELPNRGKRLVDYLMSLYPSFAAECKSQTTWYASVLSWDIAIQDLTDEEVRQGCTWCKNSNEHFMPSTGRFRHKAKGLLDTNVAFEMALEHDFSNFAVHETYRRLGAYVWNHADETTLQRRFTALYGKICEEVLTGVFESKKNGALIGTTRGETKIMNYLDKHWPLSDALPKNILQYHKFRREGIMESHKKFLEEKQKNDECHLEENIEA